MGALMNTVRWVGSGLLKLGLFGGAVVGGGGIVAEQATDDGQGGVVSRFIQNIWKKATETASTEQGRNINIDQHYAGQSWGSYLMGIVAGIARAFGFEEFAQKMEGRMQNQIRAINKAARDFKAEGDVFDETMTPSAQKYMEQAGEQLDAAKKKAGEYLGVAQEGAADAAGVVADKVSNDPLAPAYSGVIKAAVDNPLTTATGGALAYMSLKTAFKASAASSAAATPVASSGLFSKIFSVGPLKKLAVAGLVVGGVYAATQSTDDVPPAEGAALAEPAAPADPNAVSIYQPVGFVKDLAAGLSDLQSLEKWTDGTNFSSSVNLQKSATLGALTGAGWLAGQATDMAMWTAGQLGADVDQTYDYSQNWSGNVSDFSTSVMDNYMGGAPDLSGAWAQTAHFGGTLVPGGAVAKGIGLTGWLASAFRGASVGNLPMRAGPSMSARVAPAGP